ncbi:MAG: hypothetical protein ABIH23_32220, partial [bacterium]
QRSRIFIPTFAWDNPYIQPSYLASLHQLPETWKRAWLYGDVDVLVGQYLKMLDQDKHIVPYFKPHPGWYHFRSLDWGFAHNAVCCWWAVDYDGKAYIYRYLKTKETPITELAQRILTMTGADEERRIQCTVAGRDLWERLVEGHDQNPTNRADLMLAAGLRIIPAQDDRVNGWQNLIDRLHWRNADEHGPQKNPTLFIMDNCQEVFSDLCLLIHDEDHPEDVKKMLNDDVGDCVRYGARHIQSYEPPAQGKTALDMLFDKLENYGEKRENHYLAGILPPGMVTDNREAMLD